MTGWKKNTASGHLILHLFYQPEIVSGYLSGEESHHAVKVLRLGPGDALTITDGLGSLFRGEILLADARKCQFKIIEKSTSPARPFSIHLAIAPTKNIDRIEWLAEKCTEIGIEKITFIQCQTSERKSINQERMEKVVVSAMKQSQQTRKPILGPLIPFKTFLAGCTERQKFIAHVDESQPHHLINLATATSDYLILIGPEGDFTAEEIHLARENGFSSVNLGPHRLRTETAGLVAVATLNLLQEQR